jgi:hypothetical protein
MQAISFSSASGEELRVSREEDGEEARRYCHSAGREEKEQAMNARHMQTNRQKRASWINEREEIRRAWATLSQTSMIAPSGICPRHFQALDLFLAPLFWLQHQILRHSSMRT